MKTEKVAVIILGILLLMSVSLPAAVAQSKRNSVKNEVSAGKVGTPDIVYTTICAISGRHMAFPGVTRMFDGDLAVVFREGAGHVCPYGRINIVYSKDNGQSWSPPVCIFDTPADERDPSIQTLPDGRVLVTAASGYYWMRENFRKNFKSEAQYVTQAKQKHSGNYYIFSDDSGKNWSKPKKVKAFCPHGPFWHKNKFYHPSLSTKDSKRFVSLWETDPDAGNWQKTALIASSKYAKDDTRTVVYEEPHTIVLRDGTFLTALRVPSDGYMRTSFSKDQGKTWSEPIKTKVRGYPQHLLQLKDGRILATYGYRYRPYGIRACISKDGGKTWDLDNEIIIRSGGRNWDLGYPVSIELNDGRIFTVYYYNTKDRKDCFIEGAFFKLPK